MLHLAHKIHGTTIRSRDGEIGTLDDFLFEQSRWAVRYLVVNTGSWLEGRKVLHLADGGRRAVGSVGHLAFRP